MKKRYDTPPKFAISGAKIAIVQSHWHSEHTDNMVAACKKLLEEAGCTAVDVHQVPGCYEIPFAAKKLAKTKRYEAIVAVGAIVKGDTDHYQVILETCIRELGKVMYDFEIPVIMEILPVHKLEDLIARTTGEHNKGIEAAHAAAEIVAWHRWIVQG
ncbi:MAG: 6,7-dimethyl-8-ribityllumazine synthase [Bdellovibrionota bacterium]